MVSRHRLGHGQGQPLTIGQVQGVGRFQLLPPLVGDAPAAPLGRRVTAVNVYAGEVERPVPVVERHPAVLPEIRPAPFAVMVVDRLPAQRIFGKQVGNGKMFPMYARFQPVGCIGFLSFLLFMLMVKMG